MHILSTQTSFLPCVLVARVPATFLETGESSNLSRLVRTQYNQMKICPLPGVSFSSESRLLAYSSLLLKPFPRPNSHHLASLGFPQRFHFDPAPFSRTFGSE